MSSKKIESATVLIGDLSIRLRARTPDDAFELDPDYGPFIVDNDCHRRRPDVDLEVSYDVLPEIGDCEKVHDADGNWQLLKRRGRYCMSLNSPVADPPMYKLLEIDESLTRGRIHIHRPADGDRDRETRPLRYPLQNPVDEVLVTNLLSRRNGVQIHGLGVDAGGRGILMAGTFGSGKSTLARLWRDDRGAAVISDDRTIIRPWLPAGSGDWTAGQGYNLYGAPWHGDAGLCSYGGVALEQVLILRQSTKNRLEKLSPLQAASLLFEHCFLTLWDYSGVESVKRMISDICTQIPCYELHFRPEPAALDVAVEGLGG